LFARNLKLDIIFKLDLIETAFNFRESSRGNDFETYNKAQKSASAAQLNYGARCCRCNECAWLRIEMADNAGRIADASGLPLISDADTGYGSPVNVFRTVSLFEKAGVAGIHIEDQNWPKRCGHLAGKTLIPADEMAAKINAACDARKDSDFTIIARTDALALHGLNAALDRAKLYEEAGADVIFVESPQTEEEISTIPKSLSAPHFSIWHLVEKPPFYHEMKYRITATKLQFIRTLQCLPQFQPLEIIYHSCVKRALFRTS
jgi:isocitrate lyase